MLNEITITARLAKRVWSWMIVGFLAGETHYYLTIIALQTDLMALWIHLV